MLLVRRGKEPLKGDWSLPGGLLEVGEALTAGVVREVREETGLTVEPIELIELLDRIQRDGERVRYHYVLADYLCRLVGGALQAASDADAARWVERAEWNSHSALKLDPVTVQVIEMGWQRARALQKGRTAKPMKAVKRLLILPGALAVAAGLGFWVRPVSYFNEITYLRMRMEGAESRFVTVAGHRVHYYSEGPAEGRLWCWCMGWAGAPRIGWAWRPIWPRPGTASICPI